MPPGNFVVEVISALSRESNIATAASTTNAAAVAVSERRTRIYLSQPFLVAMSRCSLS